MFRTHAFLTLILVLVLSTSAHAQNSAYLLDDDGAAAKARMDLLGFGPGPFMMTFEMNQDHMSMSQLAMLRKSARAGRRPRLLLDALGHKISPEVIQYLVEQGVEIRLFRPLYPRHIWQGGTQLFQRMHDKVITTSNGAVITGGRNALNAYFGQNQPHLNYIDYDILARGPVGFTARAYQEQMWASRLVTRPIDFPVSTARRQSLARLFDTYEVYLHNTGFINTQTPLNWDRIMQPVESAEFIHDEVRRSDMPKGPRAELALTQALRSAKREVLIDAQYLILTPKMIGDFRAAIDRGVKVRIITNGKGALEIGSDKIIRNAYEISKPLLRSIGLTVYEFNGPGKIHSKAIVVDRNFCLIWSYNLDPRSQHINYESGLSIRSNELCGKLADDLNFHMNRSRASMVSGKKMLPDAKVSPLDRVIIHTIRGEL